MSANNPLVKQLLEKLQKASNTMPKTISSSPMIQNMAKLNSIKTEMKKLSEKQGAMTPENYVRLGELSQQFAYATQNFKKYKAPPAVPLTGVYGYGNTRRRRNRRSRKSRRTNSRRNRN
jgi:hypothetical protein